MNIWIVIHLVENYNGPYAEDYMGSQAGIVFYSKNKEECEMYIKNKEENYNYYDDNCEDWILEMIQL